MKPDKIKCGICHTPIQSFSRHIRHVMLRHHLVKYFKCNLKDNCNFVAQDSFQFGYHIYENHIKDSQENQEDLPEPIEHNFNLLKCQFSNVYCCSGEFDSIGKYIKHIKDRHAEIPLFECIFQSCYKTQKSSKSHIKHINQRHSSEGKIKSKYVCKTVKKLPTIAVEPDEELVIEDDDETDCDYEDETNFEDETYFGDDTINEESEPEEISFKDIENILKGKMSLDSEDLHSLQIEACRFVLDLHTKKFVPFSVVLHIINSICKLGELTLQVLQHEISKLITKSLQDPTSLIQQVNETMQNNNLSACFTPISTRWKFDKFVEENFKYVKPTVVKVNDVPVGHYSSISEILYNIMTDPTYIPSKEESTDGNIKFNHDAGVLKDNPFYKANPDTFIIKLYSDAVTVTDPLGMASKSYKLLKVNMCIVNVESWKNSRLSCIFPIFTGNLAKCKDHELEVFGPILEELKLLEKGITIKGVVIKAMVLVYLADGLESFTLLSLALSFSSNFICKLCLGLYEELDANFHHRLPVWRTEEMYNKVMGEYQAVEDTLGRLTIVNDSGEIVGYQHGEKNPIVTNEEIPAGSVPLVNPTSGSVEMIQVEPQEDLKGNPHKEHEKEVLNRLKDGQKDLGHKSETVFEGLQAFDPWKCFPPDLLHDWSEGVGTKEAAALLLACFKGGLLTVQQYNEDLLFWKSLMKDDITDWPKGLGKGSSKKLARLPYTGAATNVLIRILPAILSKYMGEDHPLLRLAGYLHSIQELLYSECVNEQISTKLEADIQSYFDMRRDFGGHFEFCKITPKYHWILHYCHVAPWFGPLWLSSTCRFEAKHRETTTCVTSFRNYKNVTFTVSRLDGYRVALDHETGLFPIEKVEDKRGQKAPIREAKPFVTEKTSCFEVATYKGTRYAVDYYVITSARNPEEIFVGKILQILIDDDSVRLVVTCSNTKRNKRKRFLEVQEGLSCLILPIEDLSSKMCLRSFKYLDNICLSIKNCPMYRELA